MKFLRQIRVKTPCQENWEAMSGGEQERFCDKCQHSVHDLTALTPAEAETLFAEATRTPCVRYIPDEKGAPIYKGTSAWKKLLAAGAIGFSGAAHAQEKLTGKVAPSKPPQNQAMLGDVAVPSKLSPKDGPVKMGKPLAHPQPKIGEAPMAPHKGKGKPKKVVQKTQGIVAPLTGTPSVPSKVSKAKPKKTAKPTPKKK